MKHHSASPMSAERRIVSPALTDFSPDEIIAAAEQDRSAARRTVGHPRARSSRRVALSNTNKVPPVP